jgi:hypothetical protein
MTVIAMGETLRNRTSPASSRSASCSGTDALPQRATLGRLGSVRCCSPVVSCDHIKYRPSSYNVNTLMCHDLYRQLPQKHHTLNMSFSLMVSQSYSCREDDDDSRSRGDTCTTIVDSTAPSASFDAASSSPRENLWTRGQQIYNSNHPAEIVPARGRQRKGTGCRAPATKPKDPPQGSQVDQPRDGGNKPTEGNVGGQTK